MKKFFKVFGTTIGILIILILLLFMGIFFRARQQGVGVAEFLATRKAAIVASRSQDLTDANIPLKTGMNRVKIQSSGQTRTSLLYVPAIYDANRPTPLVIGYHGGFGQGENQERLTHMSQVADKENFIIAFPDGVNRHWNDGRAKAVEYGTTTDDVQFTKDLIATISQRLNVDTKRIYATGISNGGMMSYRVACEMTQTFAAIAPVSSAMPIEQKDLCKPSGAIPVLMIQGTSDPLIPFNGGQMAFDVGEAIPTMDTLHYWQSNNGTSTTAAKTEVIDADPNDGTKTTHETFTGSGPENVVEFYKIDGGGHTWANGRQYAKERVIGKTSKDFDASEVIWNFFKLHTR